MQDAKRAPYSELLIKTNIYDRDPPLPSSYQLSLHFRDTETTPSYCRVKKKLNSDAPS